MKNLYYNNILSSLNNINNKTGLKLNKEKTWGLIKNVQSKIVSISESYKKLNDLNPNIENYLDIPTSGISSECEEEEKTKCYEDELEKKRNLNFKYIDGLLIDQEKIIKVKENEKEIKMILIKNIKEDLNKNKLKYFLENLNINPEIDFIKFIFYDSKFSLILNFTKIEKANKFFGSLENNCRNFIHSFGNSYEIFKIKLKETIVNNKKFENNELNLKSELKKIYNKSEILNNLYPEEFFGVIFRYIPEELKAHMLGNYLKKFNISCKIQQKCKINDTYFTLLLLNSIEDCYLTCDVLKKLKNKYQQIKINIHSKSNKYPDFNNKSLFNLFEKKYYLNFNEDDKMIIKDRINKKNLKEEQINNRERSFTKESYKSRSNSYNSKNRNYKFNNYQNKNYLKNNSTRRKDFKYYDKYQNNYKNDFKERKRDNSSDISRDYSIDNKREKRDYRYNNGIEYKRNNNFKSYNDRSNYNNFNKYQNSSYTNINNYNNNYNNSYKNNNNFSNQNNNSYNNKPYNKNYNNKYPYNSNQSNNNKYEQRNY